MNNTKSIYRIPLVSCIALMTILACCVAFIGCPETQEMADDVIMSSGNVDPNTDPNADPNVDPNADPNVDPNADPNVDPNVDPTQ